jgi:hypothetical protein
LAPVADVVAAGAAVPLAGAVEPAVPGDEPQPVARVAATTAAGAQAPVAMRCMV